MNPNDIFEQIGDFDPDNLIDKEPIINIDLDAIGEEANKEANVMISNLSKFYNDEEFLKENPSFKKTIDTELESLRILLKMRKSDEEAHDILVKAIAANSNNASLYRSLSEIQKTMLSISKSIDEILIRLANTLKTYQTEINFNETEENNSEENKDNSDQSVHRGSKEFIQSMLEQKKESE